MELLLIGTSPNLHCSLQLFQQERRLNFIQAVTPYKDGARQYRIKTSIVNSYLVQSFSKLLNINTFRFHHLQ